MYESERIAEFLRHEGKRVVRRGMWRRKRDVEDKEKGVEMIANDNTLASSGETALSVSKSVFVAERSKKK